MKRADVIELFSRLRELDPHPTTELVYSTPFELLVAVVLSAQATDVGVNKATKKLYPVANTIKVQKDRVTIETDWMDTDRTVWLDGRAHPPATQTFLHGHSTGKWEGKALVVETTNFKEHPLGLSTSMPSSTQKKLIERYELSADGKSLLYSGTVEDPVYLTAPGSFSGTLQYRPGMTHSNQKCDVEIAQRFLKD